MSRVGNHVTGDEVTGGTAIGIALDRALNGALAKHYWPSSLAFVLLRAGCFVIRCTATAKREPNRALALRLRR